MTPSEADLFIFQSRQMVSDWFAIGGPDGPVEQLLRICADNIAALEEIAVAHPDRADEIQPVLKDWRDMQSLTRERLN